MWGMTWLFAYKNDLFIVFFHYFHITGLTEMFKTPAKEKPQAMKIGPTTFSNSEDLLGKKFQVLNSEDKPLLCTPETFGWFTFFFLTLLMSSIEL